MFGQSRSQNGPGLSINTSSANSLSVSSQPQQSAGIFGTTQKDKPAASLFGPTLNSSQASNSNNLFGTSNIGQSESLPGPSSSQQQPSGSLFGGQSTQLQGGNLSLQPTQQQSGGLFGNSAIHQMQPQRGGLFSSVGQNQPQHQLQQPQQSGLFGSASQNSVAQAQNQNQRVLQKLTPSIFSTSIGQYSQQQQTVPGVRISINELRPTTRFNDLHEELQKVIESVDNFILNQMKYRDECDALLPKVIEKASPISNDVEYCSKTLETTQIALENDAEAIAYGKLLVKTDVSNAKLSFRIIQNLKMPQQFHHSGLWNAPNVSQVVGPPLIDDHVGSSKNLVSYFSQEIDDMSKTLEKYKRSIAEVEAYLKSVEDNTYHQMRQIAFVRGPDGGAKSAEDQIRELAAVLKEFENGILGVAGKVGSSREKVQEVMLGNYGNGNSRIRRV